MSGHPLTVAQVLEETSLPFGSLTQALEAAASLSVRGHRMILVTPPVAGLASHCTSRGGEYVPLPLRHPLDLPSMRRLARLTRRLHIDVVHAAGHVALGVALGASHLGGHFALLAGRGASFRVGALVALSYRSRRVYRIVASCEHVRQTVVRSAGIPPARVVVVYDGTDINLAAPGPTALARVRAELGISPDAALIGQFGVRDWEGWKELLTAFSAVRTAHAAAHLLLLGCTSRRQQRGVVELAREFGLGSAVTPSLLRDDSLEALAACDVVIDASWAGTGIAGSIREAMALAKPIVATHHGGSAELIENGVSGLLVPPREIVTMAAAIDRLLRDTELARRLGAAGRERVCTRFSTAARVGKLEQLYHEVLAEMPGQWEGGSAHREVGAKEPEPKRGD